MMTIGPFFGIAVSDGRIIIGAEGLRARQQVAQLVVQRLGLQP
jgi:hypothetical protein